MWLILVIFTHAAHGKVGVCHLMSLHVAIGDNTVSLTTLEMVVCTYGAETGKQPKGEGMCTYASWIDCVRWEHAAFLTTVSNGSHVARHHVHTNSLNQCIVYTRDTNCG